MSRHCLAEQFGGFVCDLDGVIYRGQHAVPGAVEALDAVSAPVVYATNNASGTPEEFARRLQGHGVHVQPEQVLTSSLAAARVLSRQLTSGAPVMAIGGPGVAASLRAVGLEPREPADGSAVDAVVQGYGSSVTAGDLGHAAAAIRGGARWIATNEDRTLPTEDGVAPGNGALVAALSMAVDVAPEVIGKPHPPMYEMAADLLRQPAGRVLALGDRLETDIAGAVATGMPGALVHTGVHGAKEAAAAPATMRPSYLLRDLGDLHRPYPPAGCADGFAVRGGARARVTDVLQVEGDGIDAERAAVDALHAALDEGRITVDDVGDLWRTGSVDRTRPEE